MQKNNKKIYLIIIGILLLICLTVAISYAVWRIFLVQNNSNKLASSCFKVSLTDQDAINLVDTIPITDSDGAALTPYTFTITNACDSYAAYQVNLELLNTTTMTNMSAIKVMLDDGTPSLLTTKETTEKTLTNASTAYKLNIGYLDKKATATHKLRLWIDEAVDMNTEGVQNLKLEAKVTVTASYTKEIPTAVEYITTLAQTDTTNLAVDDYGNTRYIGKDPNNYVSVDGELWRIIGVMKDIDDGTGKKEDRVKLIRNESIGEYSWDSNEKNSTNEWSQAKLMKLLNPGYESEVVGGSLYWTNKSGTCYYGSQNGTTSCDFTSTGIKEKLKALIGNAVWNTGASTTTSQIASKFYAEERGDKTGKICTSDSCNDAVERTTKWTGKIGLIYPSDIGYAVAGNISSPRKICLNTALNAWNDDCKNSDWLNIRIPTITPYQASNANLLYVVCNHNPIYVIPTYYDIDIFPSVYLLSSVTSKTGTGTKTNPYILE